MNQDFNDLRHTATALLASFIVVVIGVGVCTFFTIVFAEDPTQPILTSACVFFGAVTFIWLLREKPRNNTLEKKYFWLVGDRSKDHPRRYRLKPVGNPKIKRYGTKTPPTAEEIRKLKENSRQSCWSPKSIPRNSSQT